MAFAYASSSATFHVPSSSQSASSSILNKTYSIERGVSRSLSFGGGGPHFSDSRSRRLTYTLPSLSFPSHLEQRQPTLVPGFSDSYVRETQRRCNLGFGYLQENKIFCTTCPMPSEGYFLRQPRSYPRRSWAGTGSNEHTWRTPDTSFQDTSNQSSNSSLGWEADTELSPDSGFRTDTQNSSPHSSPSRDANNGSSGNASHDDQDSLRALVGIPLPILLLLLLLLLLSLL